MSLFQPTWDGDAHAGHVETSLQLLLRPDAVRLDRAVVGDTRPLAELMPMLQTGGVGAVTATGVLGDPTEASLSVGERVFAALVDDLSVHVAAWRSR